MKLTEVFDDNYYDFLQDEMRRKVYDPHEDRPASDTEMHMGDFVLAQYEAGKVSFEEAVHRLKEVADSPLDFQFWKTELIISAEEKGDL